jgi:SP family general alpha glucoside:H+ symporter-like MFS transporter
MSSKDIESPSIRDHDSDTQAKMDLKRDAMAATAKEQSMSLLQGIKLYPKAIAWSMFISTCIVMEGYQICLLGSLYAFPQFNKKFGEIQPDGTYQISAAWQAGLSNVSSHLFDSETPRLT